jgi:hypothetical protein
MTPANGSYAARLSFGTDIETTHPLVLPDDAVSCALYTTGGRYITGGMARVSVSPRGWAATVESLDRAGVIASMYYCDGVRDVVVRFGDGRRAFARISGTRFRANARVCDVEGVEPLRVSHLQSA